MIKPKYPHIKDKRGEDREAFLRRNDWVQRTDKLWVRCQSFIDTTDKKNALTTEDAVKIQKMIDEWA